MQPTPGWKRYERGFLLEHAGGSGISSSRLYGIDTTIDTRTVQLVDVLMFTYFRLNGSPSLISLDTARFVAFVMWLRAPGSSSAPHTPQAVFVGNEESSGC